MNALRVRLLWIVLAAACDLPCAAACAADSPAAFDVTRRVPWTTSRMFGTPEPPPPYALERQYPKLTFTEPVHLVAEPGARRLWVVERKGKILRFPDDPDAREAETLLDLGDEAYSLAFHPRYPEHDAVFVFRNLLENGKNAKNRVSRFRSRRGEPAQIDPKSEEVLLEWPSRGHNGGDLAFGLDGMLYLTSGDGETGVDDPDPEQTGQDLSDLRGGILRIDVDRRAEGRPYAIPADNPFLKTPGARPELWAFGLRNPWRFCIDRESGQMYIGNNGEETWEAVYLGKRGANYGWSVLEGSHPFNLTRRPAPVPFEPPLVEHSHAEARSVVGGRVYRGPRLRELHGAYVYGDHETGKVWALRHKGPELTGRKLLAESQRKLIAFAEAPDRELLALSYDGGIYRFAPEPAAAEAALFPRRLSETGLFASVAEHRPAPGLIPYSVNAPAWADGARVERFIAVPGDSQIKYQPADGWEFPAGSVLVQTFSLPGARDGAAQRIETRLLHRRAHEWRGYSYRWNEEQTDAALVPEEGAAHAYALRRTAAEGAGNPPETAIQQTWRFPSRSQCMVCHSFWGPRFVIGVSTPQMNRVHDYGSAQVHQLELLNRLEILSEPPAAPLEKLPRLTSPADASAPLAARARGYLHANCAHCHRYSGAGNARLRLVHDAPDSETRLFDIAPEHGGFGLTEPRLIAPGRPERSVLAYRMAKLGRGRMPHLGSHLVDGEGLALIESWIKGLAEPSPALDPAIEPALDALRRGERDAARRDAALDLALSSVSGALALSLEWDRGPRDAAVQAAILARATAHADRNVRDLFERMLPEGQRSQRLGEQADPRQILALRGNAEQGRRLFFDAAATQCKNCHQVAGVGVATGPDLSRLTIRKSRPELLESMLLPSTYVEPKYQPHVVETADGRAFLGLLVSRSPEEIVLKDVQNQELRFPLSQVEAVAPQRKSLMPDGLLRELTAQEAADLLEFIHSLSHAP